MYKRLKILISSYFRTTPMHLDLELEQPRTTAIEPLFSALPGCSVLLLPDAPIFTVIAATEDYLKMTGKSLQQIKGKGLFEVFPLDAAGNSVAMARASLLETLNRKQQTEISLGYDLPGADGTIKERHWVVRNKPVLDDSGNVTMIINTAEDVTVQVKSIREAEESEQRFRDLVAEADVATGVYFGREMRIQYANEAMLRLWGKDASVIGKTIREALPELEGQPFHEQLDHVFATGETYWGKEDLGKLVIDGKLQTFYFNFTYKALRDSEGRIYGILNMATDVTGQVMAKKMIEQNERNLRNTILQSPVAMCILRGPSFVVEVANARIYEIWGKSEKEMLGRPVFDGLPEVRNQGLEEVLADVYTKGERFVAHERPLPFQRNGRIEIVYVNFVYEPFREADGSISGVIVVAIDVTELVVARKKALEAEETAKLAIASAELGTFEINLQTDYITSSPRFDEIFEVEQTNNRQAYIDVIHPDDREARFKAYEKAYKTGLLDYEARLVRKNGALRWVRAKGRIFFDEYQKPLKISAVVMDITEEKQFAEELSRQVKERTQELEQFTYVSHHDLQEPLRKIVMFTDMVRAESYDLLSEASQSRMDKVTNAARRMSIALRDVLNYASLKKMESFVQVDLDEVLAAVQTDLELVIAEKKAKIQSDELPTIIAAPQQMHQLFYNLLNNALKFTRADIAPVITISCGVLQAADLHEHKELSPDRSYYLITVKDNGIGFDQNFAEKIFVLFQRLHSKDTYAGTGIGLALCKKVVSNHGGRIWAESKPGEGATFKILLPSSL